MATRIYKISTEYVLVQMAAKAGGVALDLATLPVSMAFMADSSAPEDEDWRSASWDVDATVRPRKYRARCLVGPGTNAELDTGDYHVWVRVTDLPEIPARYAGVIEVR